MTKQENYIMPFQPYVLLQAKQYRQQVKPYGGISHFYEFTIFNYIIEYSAVFDCFYSFHNKTSLFNT